jgi:hypothetical protein
MSYVIKSIWIAVYIISLIILITGIVGVSKGYQPTDFYAILLGIGALINMFIIVTSIACYLIYIMTTPATVRRNPLESI